MFGCESSCFLTEVLEYCNVLVFPFNQMKDSSFYKCFAVYLLLEGVFLMSTYYYIYESLVLFLTAFPVNPPFPESVVACLHFLHLNNTALITGLHELINLLMNRLEIWDAAVLIMAADACIKRDCMLIEASSRPCRCVQTWGGMWSQLCSYECTGSDFWEPSAVVEELLDLLSVLQL